MAPTNSRKLSLWCSEPFIRKKLTAYQQLLNNGSQTGQVYFNIATCLRAIGEYQHAQKHYEKALTLGYRPKESEKLVAIMAQEFSQNGFINNKKNDADEKKTCLPTPFIIVDDFLIQRELTLLWSLYDNHKSHFKQSKVGKRGDSYLTSSSHSDNKDQYTEIDSQVRNSNVVKLQWQSDPMRFFEEKLHPKLLAAYPKFDLSPPLKEHIALQMTSHGDSAFFKIHKDTGIVNINRILTFIYYFSVEPQQFTGGELLLHDTDIEREEYNMQFTKITPKNNRLVIFPSNYFHQVRPVKMQNTNDYNSRHSINGWHSMID